MKILCGSIETCQWLWTSQIIFPNRPPRNKSVVYRTLIAVAEIVHNNVTIQDLEDEKIINYKNPAAGMYKKAGESPTSLPKLFSSLCFVEIVFTKRNYRKRVERNSTEAKAFFTSLPKWFHFHISKAEINQRHDKINSNQI